MPIMDEMMRRVFREPGDTLLRVEWKDLGLMLEGMIDTCYESCNCLEEDDPDYKEYYACALRITRILQCPADFPKQTGDLIEISIDRQCLTSAGKENEAPFFLEQPTAIRREDGTLVWSGEETMGKI